jgi:polysaccharide export outer membrane protein
MNLNQIIYKIKNRWLFAIPLILSFNSCISNKDYIYLQNKTNTSSKDSNETFVNHSNPYKLKPNDILYIKLVTEDEKMNALFNPMGNGGQTMQLIQQPGSTGTPFYFMGYSLDQDGNLELPYLGKLNLAGKNIEEAKFIMETEVKKYFKTFFLQIKLAEFRFSILGAVNRPGQFFFMVNKLNILEALAMAGDVNEIAKRSKLTLIREENGQTKMVSINLTDNSLLKSPYFYIHPNDILYVQPVKSRSLGNLSNFQGTLSAVLPIFSTFLLVLNTYIILQNIK